MSNHADRAFSERLAHWTAQGFSGAAVYQKLAADPDLPTAFDSRELAGILGITELSVKKQRHRGGGPSYYRTTSTKGVRYPRAELCEWLGSRFVRVANDNRGARAAA
ncbi:MULTISPECIES: hypothetical protein [unclassified Mesorhizobium]|uniref:hypothetical protein n=1 Tax=unclassified Mesorhizobium TaxID=325217 RepID=UPI000FD78929|nr:MULTISPECIES: hypothetical protein [unclassified Mesorhizobium]TGR58278.1 hypothetical protein EN842_01410 [bacterium M00.F.Ca.ET.199.01.1.1]TGU41614.1 hypothetical protein EN799_03405 [bacterium M00.F.Ca.ET.156.01.1.1]TGV89762.1 hypothetical protein EN792_006280 [Mesorhizobium sp. M00.F.Ca.ET.149.01.1.1]TGR33020.1 hypothetical protein EN840_01410 [Mesorhizobium sp. M8A.F.Ca.ET.197.01.1.1]TGR34666.1 hypothetical protein EN845_01410 [Mesorhizobium sp. M8A.F.Ca.ET.202.01.1.1]